MRRLATISALLLLMGLASVALFINNTNQAYAEGTVKPTKPTLYLPSNGDTISHNTPYFEWTKGENADNHRLLVDNDSDFSSPKENRLVGYFFDWGGYPTRFYATADDASISGLDEVYSIIHDAESGHTLTNYLVTSVAVGQELEYSDYYISRSYLIFDTSDLPSGATIASASLFLNTYGKWATANFDIIVQSGQPNFPHVPVVLSDYNCTKYYGDGGSINTANCTTGSLSEIPLSEYAYSNWIKSDVTKLVLRCDNDIDNIAPTVFPNRIEFASYESGSPAYLEITYKPLWVTENYYQVPPENAYENSTYYWKVIAINENGENASDVWTFTVGPAVAGWHTVETWTGTVQAPAPPLLGVEVSISPASKSGLPESILTYTVTVKNTGTVSDSYTLENTDNAGWTLSLSSNSVGPLSGGASGTVTLSVTVPAGAENCTRDNVTVKATSQADNTVESENSCIAHAVAEIRRGVQVSIEPSNQDGDQGSTLTYTVTVTNTGNVAEDYNLTADDDHDWSLTIDTPVTDVAPDESEQATLTVVIPATAENCTRDNVTVTVTSSENTAVENSASCVAHCLVGAPPPTYGVEISISPLENEGSPGETVTFTVTVTNTGNVDDTYTLENSDNSSWSLSISPTSLTVPAGENRPATLSVAIPENVAACTRDNMRVRATSQADDTVYAEDLCIAHVAIIEEVSRWPLILGAIIATAAAITGALVARHLRKRRRKKRRRAEARRLRRLKDIIEGEE